MCITRFRFRRGEFLEMTEQFKNDIEQPNRNYGFGAFDATGLLSVLKELLFQPMKITLI